MINVSPIIVATIPGEIELSTPIPDYKIVGAEYLGVEPGDEALKLLLENGKTIRYQLMSITTNTPNALPKVNFIITAWYHKTNPGATIYIRIYAWQKTTAQTFIINQPLLDQITTTQTGELPIRALDVTEKPYGSGSTYLDVQLRDSGTLVAL